MAKRCVITGIGMLCALGNDAHSCFDALKRGVCGIDEVRTIRTDGCYTHLGAEVRCDDLPAPACDRSVRLCLHAAQEAVADAQLSPDDISSAGVLLGSCVGGASSIDEYYTALQHGERKNELIVQMFASNLAAQVAQQLGAGGYSTNVVNACAAGAMSVAHACRLLRSGRGAVYLAGGTDSFSSLAYAGFLALHALSADVCSPFNRSDGITLGEGSAVLVVEDYEHARARGAQIYCEVTGSGVSSDAFHITAPHPQGEGQQLALTRALREAGLESVDYVNAHGTGTAKNDAAEFLSLHTLFDNAQKKPSVSATKSMTGHCLGATGAMETAFCALALREQVVLPTAGYTDEQLALLHEKSGTLDFVANTARPKQLTAVMSNSFAFGGTNASLILSAQPRETEKTQRARYVITGIGFAGAEEESCELTPEDFNARGVKLGFYRKLDRFSQLELLAGIDALRDAQLEISADNAAKTASITGTCDGPMGEILTFQQNVCKNGTAAGSAFSFPNTVYNAAGGYLSIFTGIKGYCATLANGTAAGIEALCHACTELDAGEEQASVVSATDEAAAALRELYTVKLGEASAAVIVENAAAAQKRNARVYAQIAGYACLGGTRTERRTQSFAALLRRTAQRACDDAQISEDALDAVYTTVPGAELLFGARTRCIGEACRAAGALRSVQAAAEDIRDGRIGCALCISVSHGGDCAAVVVRSE